MELRREELKLDKERALLVGVVLPGAEPSYEPPLQELRRLARTAGAEVTDVVLQRRSSIAPATYVGKGKAREIAEIAEAFDVDVVITNHDLSPAQLRNLEKLIDRKVVDRSELILDIFASGARTRQARVQVELAQLEYTKTRLRRMWTHLSRIQGGIGFRGPGEKQIEVDKRLVRKRLRELRNELRLIEERRHRQAASRSEYVTVSLVGYTNAGKSTLMRALTDADVGVEDKLFSTLDTKTREWVLPRGERVFLSDTVGFIRDLPHHLIASFHATLEEARNADLLLHVVDAANPNAKRHIDSVTNTLEQIGAGDVPRLMVFNKSDRLEDMLPIHHLADDLTEWVLTSAETGRGLGELATTVSEWIDRRLVDVVVHTHAGHGRLLARLAETGRIVAQRYLDGDRVEVEVRLSPKEAARLRHDTAGRAEVLLVGEPTG